VYGGAAGVLRQPRYQDVARTTLDFMRETLADASGGFYSST
jgi:uncharacterized protein YyaL (SSP411 family)